MTLLKRGTPPFCALALAAFPLLSLFAHNQTDIELRVLWLPLTFTVIGALALFGLFLLVTRQAAKAGVLASLVVTAFFYYGLSSTSDRRGSSHPGSPCSPSPPSLFCAPDATSRT